MAEKGRIAGLFDFIDRLSTREKAMVGALMGAFVLTLAVIIYLVIGKQIQALAERNDTLRTTLSDVMAQKDSYLLEKAKLDAKKEQLDTNEVKLVKVMEDQARRLGFTIEDFKENKRFLTENHRRVKKRAGSKKKVIDLVEESQTVTIRRISLDQLSRFLQAIESRREPIKVTRLNAQTLTADRQVLREVRLTVSTYRNEEVEP